MKQSYKKLALGLALTGLVAWQANATLAYDFTSATGDQSSDGPNTLGNVFTVNSSILVDALGVFGGSAASADVAIYSITTSGLTITGGSIVASASGVASGNMQSISSVLLGSGTYMIVANNMGLGGVSDYNPAYDPANGGSFGSPASTGVNKVIATSTPLITFSPNGYYLASSGPLPANPNGFGYDSFWAGGGPRYGAANFDFAPVPEIGVFGTASAGLLGLIYVGRCGLRKRKVA